MWFTALLPPPPTPITLMIEDFSFGKSKCIMSQNLATHLMCKRFAAVRINGSVISALKKQMQDIPV
jgi:hypothetical protein